MLDDAGDDATALFRMAVDESRSATELLGPAKMVWPRAKAAADFSYRVKQLVGDGWIAVGDAGGFFDPLFSTGTHVAMCGAKTAAETLLGLLAPGGAVDEAAKLEAWETELEAGADTFILAVQAFYAGPLMEQIFSPNKHSALRRSITSLLAGDVFTDSVWLRDTRLRLKEWALRV